MVDSNHFKDQRRITRVFAPSLYNTTYLLLHSNITNIHNISTSTHVFTAVMDNAAYKNQLYMPVRDIFSFRLRSKLHTLTFLLFLHDNKVHLVKHDFDSFMTGFSRGRRDICLEAKTHG